MSIYLADTGHKIHKPDCRYVPLGTRQREFGSIGDAHRWAEIWEMIVCKQCNPLQEDTTNDED